LRLGLFFPLLFLACAEAPADRTVYTFFDAMRQGDANRMAEVLDSSIYLGRSGAAELDTLTPGDDFEARRNRVLLELTGGNLKRLWMTKQIVVGRTETSGDTAAVEVSFVDTETEKQYLTRFVLLKKSGTWQIVRFRKT
jgi:hypothetical protein